MRKLIALICFSTGLVLIAFGQTAGSAIPVDWRYRLYWDDPNPTGTVANWIVYGSSPTTGLISVGSPTNNIGITDLLNGKPAGVYTLYTTAISLLGAEGDPGTQLAVFWPGGNGKLRGGGNLRVLK